MTACLIGYVVTEDAWGPDYVARVHEIAASHGGRFLSRSGIAGKLEGTAPDVSVMVLIEFPSVADAEAFFGDPDYAPIAAARRAGSISDLFVIDRSDVVGVIPYLPKG